MGDEGEFQLFEDVRPMRASGIVSLIFGLLSPLTYFGFALIFIPVIALFTGLRATSRYDGDKPAGYNFGQIGMVLALFFGLLGATIWGARRATLTNQAEYYAKAFLDTMAHDQPEVAKELTKEFYERTDAPLVPFYASNSNRVEFLNLMKNGPLYRKVNQIDGKTNWKISRPTRITRGFYGVEKAEVCLVDAEGRINMEAQIFLDLTRDRDGRLQWHVMHSQPYRELIVAEGNG